MSTTTNEQQQQPAGGVVVDSRLLTIRQLAEIDLTLKAILDNLNKTTGDPLFATNFQGANVKQIPASTQDVELLQENPYRQELVIYNFSNSVLYLIYAKSGASPTNFTTIIPAGNPFVVGAEFTDAVYTGPVHGVWATANGFAAVTEV